MLLQLRDIRFCHVFLVKISEQTTNFFSMTRVLFGLLIFLVKLCLKVGGVAYTQERLIHECLQYTKYTLFEFEHTGAESLAIQNTANQSFERKYSYCKY